MILSRRNLLVGIGASLAAPAIVRAESLMPVRYRFIPREVWFPSFREDGFFYAHELNDLIRSMSAASVRPVMIAGVESYVRILPPAGAT